MFLNILESDFTVDDEDEVRLFRASDIALDASQPLTLHLRLHALFDIANNKVSICVQGDVLCEKDLPRCLDVFSRKLRLDPLLTKVMIEVEE